jgi:hypothetical protein
MIGCWQTSDGSARSGEEGAGLGTDEHGILERRIAEITFRA